MKFLKTTAIVAASLAMAAVAYAFDRGPAVGAAIPSQLEAPDQTGAPRAFANLRGDNGLVLVFNRSASWCPVCQRQMLELETVRAAIEAEGYQLVVLTTDEPREQAAFVARRAIGYDFLSDPQSAIIDAFGLRDPAFPVGHRIHGVPVPSVFVIDEAGVVQAKLGDDDYRVRPAAEVVLQTVQQQR